MIERLWYDVAHAWRLMRRAPRDTIIAVAILAIGIGANTAMFSAINGVLLRPLPFGDPDQLIRLRDATTSADGQQHAVNMSSRNVFAVAARASSLDGLAAFSGESLTMVGADVPERVSVIYQSPGALGLLRVAPSLGRGFTPDEERAGLASGVALVSDAFWRARLGSASVPGARIRLEDREVTIVGVMPREYAFPYDAQLWMPFALDPADRSRDFAVFARLKPGLTRQQAVDDLTRVAGRMRSEVADTLPTYGIEVMPIRDNLLGQQDRPLKALAAIVALLLLIACANVATMLLARAVSRRREFAIRAALGAGRARHARQLAAESLLLAAAGCAAGLLLASWIRPLTSVLIPNVLRNQLGLTAPEIDGRVLAFAVGATIASALVAGLIPAYGSWTASPQLALTETGRTTSPGPAAWRALGGLMAAETALTLVLLAGAGLVIRHFLTLQAEPLGFEAHGLLTVEVTPPVVAYPPGPRRAEIVRRIVNELRAAPGVVSASATTVNPLGGGTWGAPVITEERASSDPRAIFNVNHRVVTPGLFETMRIPLLRGRTFTDQDSANGLPVVIVSQRLAQRFWPHVDAIGRRIRIARPNASWLTVVGIVGDVNDSHDPGVPLETWYLPLEQQAASPAAEKFNLMVRTTGDALALLPEVQRAVARVDKTLAIFGPAAMDAYFRDSLRRERVGSAFLFGFGAFGLMLAALGIYGVVALTVAHRVPEIGLRLALGAQPRDILPIVLRRSVGLVAAGLAVGAVVAGAATRALSSAVGDVGSLDWAVLAGAAALILLASSIACVVPALRAARLDPTAALKAD